MPVSRHPWFHAACTLCSLAALACDSGSGGVPQVPPPTMIVVNPEEFAHNVACLPEPGAMRSYVATLFDVTSDLDGAVAPELSSSPPTNCAVPVGFGFVQPGRKYRAEIDAYDRSDLQPLTPGNRLMQQSGGSSVELLRPRWRAACGNPATAGDSGVDLGFLSGPAEAFLNTSVTVMGCTPFVEIQASPTRTSIRVDLSQALGDLHCGDGAGQVFDYSVRVINPPTTTQHSLCNQSVVFVNLRENEAYSFSIDAFERPAAAFVPGANDSGSDSGVNGGGVSGGDASLLDAALPNAAAMDAALTDAALADSALPTVPGDAAASPAAVPRWHATCYQRAATGVERTAVCDSLQPLL